MTRFDDETGRFFIQRASNQAEISLKPENLAPAEAPEAEVGYLWGALAGAGSAAKNLGMVCESSCIELP